MNITKKNAIMAALVCTLGVSICLNVWYAFNLMELTSQNAELEYLKKPLVHLTSYEWKVIPISWEFEYVQINYTLFNSGYTDANFTLSIDLLDNQESFMSEEYPIHVNATSRQVFSDLRINYELLVNHHHANGIEFYCVYFEETSEIQKS
jgi:hypothetical protein